MLFRDPVRLRAGAIRLIRQIEKRAPAYRRVLVSVIAINLVGFGAVLIGSIAQASAALAANALDFLADSVTYTVSLWVIGRSVQVRATAALVKSASLAALGVGVLAFATWRALTGAAPEGVVITGLGAFGFAANLVAAALLIRFRDGAIRLALHKKRSDPQPWRGCGRRVGLADGLALARSGCGRAVGGDLPAFRLVDHTSGA